MKRLAITGVVALLAGPAVATDWVRVTTPGIDVTAYVDADSVRRMGDIAQAWTKLVVTNPEPGRLGQLLRLMAYSCSAHSAAIMNLVAYKPDNTLIDSKKVSDVVFEDVPPDTVEDVLTTYVCISQAK